jgi:hypothetical protein
MEAYGGKKEQGQRKCLGKKMLLENGCRGFLSKKRIPLPKEC